MTYEDIRNIVLGKLVDHSIDEDYEELSERLFGEGNCFSSSEVRKRMYGMKAVIDAIERDSINKTTDSTSISELESKRIELMKERQKFFDQRVALNKVIRERSRQEELNEILLEAVSSGSLPRLNYEPNTFICSDNDLLVSLNDIHYGANIHNYWNVYNSEICKDMMCKYLDRVISIATTHSSENCYVWANGDEISGNIHHSIAVTNKENVIEQIKGVSELISEFIAELSKHFSKVTYISVAGNHSRINPQKDLSLASERLDDLIEWYLAARLQNFENVTIGGGDKIDNTMYVIDIRGKSYCGIHGDFDGTASKVQTLQTMVRKPLYAVLSGHMHHNKIDEVQGVKTIMAGSFQGMDDFCVQKRIYGKPEQLVCVCDDTGIRCTYDVPLN